jgi:hypothetical protein
MEFVVAFIAAGTVDPVPVSHKMTLALAQESIDAGNAAIARKARRIGAPIGDRYVALAADCFAAQA